jgi:hypothetical protein
VSYPSRLAALAHLNAEMAEAEVSRWERVVERLSAAGDPTRAARNCLRAAQDDLVVRGRQKVPSGLGTADAHRSLSRARERISNVRVEQMMMFKRDNHRSF